MRIGAVFIAALWLAPWVVGAWRGRGAWRTRLAPAATGASALKALAAATLAAAIIILPWPYLREDPLEGVRTAIGVARQFPETYPVLFDGRLIQSNDLPRTYLPVYLGLSLPPWLLFGLVLGFGRVIPTLRKGSRRARVLAIIAAWGMLPLAAAIVLHPSLYDTIRHFIFVLPGLAVLTGWGLAGLAAWLRADGWSRGGVAAALVLATATAAGSIARWHPYEYAYSNFFAGPAATRHQRWENDYWVTSYREAAEWINARQAASDRPLRIAVAANEHCYRCFGYYVAPRVRVGGFMGRVKDVQMPDNMDYYVSMIRYGMAENFPQNPTVHVISRAGVAFCVIKGRRPANSVAEPPTPDRLRIPPMPEPESPQAAGSAQ